MIYFSLASDAAAVKMCVCITHTHTLVAFQIHIFPLSLFILAWAGLNQRHLLQSWKIMSTSRPAALGSLLLEGPTPPSPQLYSGCSGWVCRPFSGRGRLWCSQKALCKWSSSDISGRPMSKCIFRFSNHSSSLENAGLLSASRSQHKAAIGKKAGGQFGG